MRTLLAIIFIVVTIGAVTYADDTQTPRARFAEALQRVKLLRESVSDFYAARDGAMWGDRDEVDTGGRVTFSR